MNLPAIKTLLINTLQKEFRSKTIYALFGLTILMVFIIHGVFGFIQDQNVVANFLASADTKLMVFYFVISLWNTLLSGIMGVGCIRSDFSHSVIHQLLSLPIRRYEYLLSRILGTWIIVISYYVLSIIIGMIIFSILDGEFIFNIYILSALVVSSFAMLAIICLGVFFSQYGTKIVSLLSTLFMAGFISAANRKLSAETFSGMFEDVGLFKGIGLVLHFLLPRTGTLNSVALSLSQDKEIDVYLVPEILHFVVTLSLLFWFISFLFKKRDF